MDDGSSCASRQSCTADISLSQPLEDRVNDCVGLALRLDLDAVRLQRQRQP